MLKSFTVVQFVLCQNIKHSSSSHFCKDQLILFTIEWCFFCTSNSISSTCVIAKKKLFHKKTTLRQYKEGRYSYVKDCLIESHTIMICLHQPTIFNDLIVHFWYFFIVFIFVFFMVAVFSCKPRSHCHVSISVKKNTSSIWLKYLQETHTFNSFKTCQILC